MNPSVHPWLLDRMAAFADREAVVHGERSLTYAELLPPIEAWQRALAERDLAAGSVVAVRGDYSPGICALFLALLFGRRVVVALPLNEDVRPLLAAAAAEGLFEFADDGASWSYTSLTPRTPPGLLERLRARGAPGLVVFTSGTTGHGKAALFDFGTLVERYRTPRPGYRTLVFLKLDHLGGVHTMLHTLAHGGTLVIGDERQPEAVARAIERHRIQLLPTTPTFLRMLVISRVHERYDLSSLKLITYGTEPMPASTLAALQRTFPGVGLKQTYGLTELGVLPTRSRAPGSLWLEVGGRGCEARVVDNVLWLRSQTAMLGYLNAPSPFDEDGWYNTHDVVEVDGPYVRILGRTTELINVGGQKVYPNEVESALLELQNVSDVTVWGEANRVRGLVVAARVSLAQPEDQESFERRLRRFCRGRLADYKVPLVVEIVAGSHHGQRFKKVRPGSIGVVA
jgi:acyl-CoA synthetase (AMP-forming)/AMP-acid ligase II